jgi:hypothetical protein
MIIMELHNRYSNSLKESKTNLVQLLNWSLLPLSKQNEGGPEKRMLGI